MSDRPTSQEPDEDEPVRGTLTVIGRPPDEGADDPQDLFADEERSPRRMILAVMVPEDGPELVVALEREVDMAHVVERFRDAGIDMVLWTSPGDGSPTAAVGVPEDRFAEAQRLAGIEA
jgi:hypothetical protein